MFSTHGRDCGSGRRCPGGDGAASPADLVPTRCEPLRRIRRNAAYAEELGKRYLNLAKAVVATRFMIGRRRRGTLTGYSNPAPGEVTTVGPLLYAGIGDRLHSLASTPVTNSSRYMEGRSDPAYRLPGAWLSRDGVKLARPNTRNATNSAV